MNTNNSELQEIVIDSIELKIRPLLIQGVQYNLVELDGEQRDKHLTNVAKRMRYSNGVPVGMDDFTDFQANLLERCLRDQNGAKVPIATIRKWPGSVLETLANAAQALSGLDKGRLAAVEAAKND